MKVPRFMLITAPDVGRDTSSVRSLLLHPDLAGLSRRSWMLQWRDRTELDGKPLAPLHELRSELDHSGWDARRGPLWQINAGISGAIDSARRLGAGLHFPESVDLPAFGLSKIPGREATPTPGSTAPAAPPAAPPGPSLVGRSTHSLESAREAEKARADYVLFGPVFETPSKASFGPPQGLERLREITTSVRIPVLAVGGIDLDRVPLCRDAGAHGVAVIREVWEDPEPGAKLRQLLAATAATEVSEAPEASKPTDTSDVSKPAPVEPDPVEVPIEDFIDLHFFRPKEILDVVDAYLEAAQQAGFVEVRLIHGKGKGFQRDRIQRMLETHDRVDFFRDAPAHRGHWGATMVTLKPL